MKYLLSALTLLPVFSFAGDKIGNGGGVWVCENQQKDIFDIMFMDVFEARREYQLTLPETTLPVLDVVKNQKDWLLKMLPAGTRLVKHIEYVEKNITWIDDVITQIPDAAAKISPHPSTCPQGEWKAVQLVNFTNDFRILVRRELFNSPLMTDLERAAVYLHEGVYSYMRESYGDNDSVRTRAIVGYLLSDLADADKQMKILGVLGQQSPTPPTPPAPGAQGYICGIKIFNNKLYIGEGANQKVATDAAKDACVKGENNLPGMPGMPTPPPGFPEIGPSQECSRSTPVCESFNSSSGPRSCTLSGTFLNRSFSASGRTKLEAQKFALDDCMTENSENTCTSSLNQFTCN